MANSVPLYQMVLAYQLWLKENTSGDKFIARRESITILKITKSIPDLFQILQEFSSESNVTETSEIIQIAVLEMIIWQLWLKKKIQVIEVIICLLFCISAQSSPNYEMNNMNFTSLRLFRPKFGRECKKQQIGGGAPG